MFTRMLQSGASGGGNLPPSYVFSYSGGLYYIYKDTVEVSKSESLNYQDENINIQYAGTTHRFTVTALTKIRRTATSQQGGSVQLITFTDYESGDVILDSSALAYGLIPLFLQVLE